MRAVKLQIVEFALRHAINELENKKEKNVSIFGCKKQLILSITTSSIRNRRS